MASGTRPAVMNRVLESMKRLKSPVRAMDKGMKAMEMKKSRLATLPSISKGTCSWSTVPQMTIPIPISAP